VIMQSGQVHVFVDYERVVAYHGYRKDNPWDNGGALIIEVPRDSVRDEEDRLTSRMGQKGQPPRLDRRGPECEQPERVPRHAAVLRLHPDRLGHATRMAGCGNAGDQAQVRCRGAVLAVPWWLTPSVVR
jgi:hypothetical protein